MDFLAMIAAGLFGLIFCCRIFGMLIRIMGTGMDAFEESLTNKMSGKRGGNN